MITTASGVDKRMAPRVQGSFAAIWHGRQMESIHRGSMHASRAMTRLSHPMKLQLGPPPHESVDVLGIDLDCIE